MVTGAVLDITGVRFGRLVAESHTGWHQCSWGKRIAIWRCVCDCGSSVEVKKPYLTSGDKSSCGCLKRETTRMLKMKHGISHKSKAYDIWVLMRQRCNNPKASGYKYYGAKGVAVCDRWQSFKLFLEDMGERPDGLTLDRINPFGNYEPSNCRWATWSEQSENKRKEHHFLKAK